jgi:GTP diphosphokinase / guanosine-3',5'-bis(diphosphate) 3'-diphosphatase
MPGTLTLSGLLEKVASYSHGKDLDILKKAYHFSREAHCSQKRSEGSPYIKHPLAVASILAEMKMDPSSISAGLLHDTIEDTGTTIEDIREIFGKEIAFIVKSLTKLSKVEFRTKKEAQAENFRKMLLAMSEDVRVILIKFADRLHNMRTLEHLPESKQQRIAAETLEIYAPLANRLGIGWLRTELEDLSFRFLMPDLYGELVRKVAKRKEEQEGYIRDVIDIVSKKLKEEGLPGRVSGRIKHYYGIYQKMQKQRITFEEVHDVIGLRILTDTKSNCYAILGLIHSLWTPIPGRFKDYIGVPKSNMYQSLHTSVIGPQGERVEFQIRTEEMHRIAEEGIAAHWKYKEKGGDFDDKSSKYISWLRDLVQVQKEVPDAMDFLEAVKGEVVPEVVYVFTPKGEIKEMPLGSTPVDFAYGIHTQVGHRCVGAKINAKIVPLRYKLKNGDTIEIITSQTHGPSRDWLKFVVTQRAKTRIKQWIKGEERNQSVELGIKLLEAELRKHNMSNTLMKSDEILKAAKALGLNSLEDLYVSVGFGKMSPQQVVNRLMPEKTTEEVEVRVRKPAKEQKGVSIRGIDNVLYHTAKCCYPIPGDNLVGFVTIGKGVTIHRKECSNLERLIVEDARLVDVDWQASAETTANARLYVETIDKPGILANISALVSSVNINITHLEATSTQDKRGRITFIMEVRDMAQLRTLIQKISQMEGILRVKR